jgi:RNA methyltransferase, RsmE family
MSRFFINASAVDIDAKSIIISGDDVNHIKNVLRAVSGDKLVVSDGSGNEYTVCIDNIYKEKISATIIESYKNRTEPPIEVTLFQGIPKSDKMDTIIQKSVELGISKIVPVITERTVVRFDGIKDMEAKAKRWQRISLEAAKQCNRGLVPVVELPLKFDKALEASKEYALKLIPYEIEREIGIRNYLKDYSEGKICFYIGPEGGFTDNEIDKAIKSNIIPVTLGPRILRTETAGAAVLSILMYELGDMGK